MTEKDITQSINKHSVKPLLAFVLLIFIVKILNGYFFESDPISSTLITTFAIGACLYTFKKYWWIYLLTRVRLRKSSKSKTKTLNRKYS